MHGRRPSRGVRALWALTVILPLVAGCVTTPPLAPGPSLTVPLTVRVVTAGFTSFDAQALRDHLQAPVQPFNMVELDATGKRVDTALRYDVRFAVTPAPDGFARDLFAAAQGMSRPDQPDAWLRTYDHSHGDRVCPAPAPSVVPVAPPPAVAPAPPRCKDIGRIDALAFEAWIQGHRDAYGLGAVPGTYTLFVLDSYTEGLLPKDTYHQYALDDGADQPATSTMRAWGGTQDFAFLDVGAAPSAYDYQPLEVYDHNGTLSGTDVVDGPIWEYGTDLAPFYARLGRDVSDATSILWARNPLYPYTYAEHFILEDYAILDTSNSHNPSSPLHKLNPQDVRAHSRLTQVQQAFLDLMPWATVDIHLTVIDLATQDPGLAAAVHDAQARADTSTLDLGVVRAYVRDHWDTYVHETPGALTIPFFGFFLDAPVTDFYALSDGDGRGHALAVFAPIGDILPCRLPRTECFGEDALGATQYWGFWNDILVHEVGHSLGLNHAHDTGGLEPDGYETYPINWLWDSTASAMTYRHNLLQFDQFDQDVLARNFALDLADRVLASGVGGAAGSGASHARDLLLAGQWQAALASAQAAWHAAGSPAAQASALTAGAALTHTFTFASGAYPGGYTPSALGFPVPPSAALPAGTVPVVQAFDWTPPAGTREAHLEFAETAGASHARWSAYMLVRDGKGTYITFTDDGKDDRWLEDLSRCVPKCTVEVDADSGVATSYTVVLTPYA